MSQARVQDFFIFSGLPYAACDSGDSPGIHTADLLRQERAAGFGGGNKFRQTLGGSRTAGGSIDKALPMSNGPLGLAGGLHAGADVQLGPGGVQFDMTICRLPILPILTKLPRFSQLPKPPRLHRAQSSAIFLSFRFKSLLS